MQLKDTINEPYTDSAFLFDYLMGTDNVQEECNQLDDIFQQYFFLKPDILDFGCGTGLHTIELSDRGFPILGIDTSKHMLDIAKTKCKRNIFKYINIFLSFLISMQNETQRNDPKYGILFRWCMSV